MGRRKRKKAVRYWQKHPAHIICIRRHYPNSANIVDSSKENEGKTEEEENAVEVDGLDGLGEEEEN